MSQFVKTPVVPASGAAAAGTPRVCFAYGYWWWCIPEGAPLS